MKIPFTRRKITVETRSPRSVPTSLQEVVQIGTPRAMALWLASTYNDERDTQLGQLNREQSLSLTDLLTPESAEELLESVWGYRHVADTRLVNVHVQRLRSKVERDPENPSLIVTVRGVGYRAGTGM